MFNIPPSIYAREGIFPYPRFQVMVDRGSDITLHSGKAMSDPTKVNNGPSDSVMVGSAIEQKKQ